MPRWSRLNEYFRVAVYARVSSDQQAEAGTIASQLEELKDRMAKETLKLEKELTLVDDGYSGATLVHPALERLRDVAAAGAIDRVYIHSPDLSIFALGLVNGFDRINYKIDRSIPRILSEFEKQTFVSHIY